MATNILASRLEKLESNGLIIKKMDKNDKRKKVYSLTQAGIDMLPILLEMLRWSSKYAPQTDIPEGLVERIEHDRENLVADITSSL